MLRFFIVLTAIFLSLEASSQDQKINCKNPQTQADMNYCAAKEFEKADQELNRIYKEVISKVSPEAKTLLVTAQKNWISVRDSHCAIYSQLYKGGSIMPLMVSNCKTELTQNRIKELKTLLQEFKN